MEYVIDLLMHHQMMTFPFLSFLILIAAVGAPISIDILLVVIAVMATEMSNVEVIFLYGTFAASCIASASLAYWVGRVGKKRLDKIRLFAKFFNEKRLIHLQKYYKRFGFWTIFLVRFIPFGARNFVYYTSGISRLSYLRFLCSDIAGTLVWSGIFFLLFYTLGHSLESLLARQKTMHWVIFSAFSVTVISIICYKVIKRKKRVRSVSEE